MKRIAAGVLLLMGARAWSCGGPLGIDCRLPYDNAGIWYRPAQLALINGMLAGEIAGGFWEGDSTRLGDTFWRSMDASAATGISEEDCRRLNLSYVDPASVDLATAALDGSTLVVRRSGETLYGVRS